MLKSAHSHRPQPCAFDAAAPLALVFDPTQNFRMPRDRAHGHQRIADAEAGGDGVFGEGQVGGEQAAGDALQTGDVDMVGLEAADAQMLMRLRGSAPRRVRRQRAVQQLQQSLDAFAAEFDHLMAQDAALPARERVGLSLLLALRPWSLSVFADLRRAPGAP